MKQNKLAILIILLTVSTIFSITAYGKSEKIIKIGVTASGPDAELRTEAILQLATEDIEAWVEENNLDVKFKFKLRNNNLDLDQTLKNTRLFDKSGYDVIVGHGYSSQCEAALDYVNENDMLLFSPTSTSPILSVPEDNLYRLIIDDNVQGRVLAYFMAEYGIKAVSVVYIDDVYGQGLKDVFVAECANFGIDVISENPVEWSPDFDSLLPELDAELLDEVTSMGYSLDEIAIEMAVYRYQTEPAFETIQNNEWEIIDQITWFGCDATASSVLAENYGEVASQVKLICPVFGAQWNSPEHMALLERFQPIVGEDMNAYDPITYDCLRILAEAMVLAEDHYDIEQIKQALENVVTDYYGVSGICNFNENGDRIGSDFDFWGFCEVDEEYHFWIYGRYNLSDDSIEIFEEPVP